MPVRPTRRLQRHSAASFDDVDHQAAQRTVFGGPGVVASHRREVDRQVESLATASSDQPRTGDGAGGKLCWTDPSDERRLCVVSDRRMWTEPVTDSSQPCPHCSQSHSHSQKITQHYSDHSAFYCEQKQYHETIIGRLSSLTEANSPLPMLP